MAGVEHRAFSFVANVDQLPFESSEDSLEQHRIVITPLFRTLDHIDSPGGETHRFIEVHVVGEDVDVGVEDPGLANHLFQNVPDPSREDEQGHIVLVQMVEEELESVPGEPEPIEMIPNATLGTA